MRLPWGETFIITQAEQPVAELRPLTPDTKPQRPYGLCAGKFTVPDDFDAPLPNDILSAFENNLI